VDNCGRYSHEYESGIHFISVKRLWTYHVWCGVVRLETYDVVSYEVPTFELLFSITYSVSYAYVTYIGVEIDV